MRVIRNERHIRTRTFVGRYLPWAGIITLGIGWFLSFQPQYFSILWLTLVVGFSLAVVGGFFADRYAGYLAHYKTLAEALKGLDNRHVLLQYVLPAAHVLVDPGGCTVFVVKNQGGEITYEKGRWRHRQKGKFFRQFAGQEAVGAPDYEAERQVDKLNKWLAKHLPDAEVPVRGAIVFVNPDVQVKAEESPVPAFYGKKVKAWLRGPGKRKAMAGEVYRRLLAAAGVTEEGG